MTGSGLFNLFKRGPTKQPIETEDTAYASGSLVYNGGMFMQYNPDELLTRKGFGVYKKMMTDEQVKAVVRFHRDAVTGRDWSFEDHPDLSDTENENRRQVLTGIVSKVPGSFKTKLDMIMSSIQNGFSMTEKTFDLVEISGKHWVGIKSLSLKPFDTFYFNLDEFGGLLSVEQQASGRRVDLEMSKFIHHVQNADVHEYYGQSELREAYRAWWSKDTALILQNIWLERSAAGFSWAQPAKGAKALTTKSPEYTQLQTVLKSIRSSSSMILPLGVEFNIEHPRDTQAFERAVQGHDKAIAKSLLMPNLLGLSEQGPNGSRALGDTQLEAFLWMLDAEATSLAETANEQLFADLANQNWPDGQFPRFILHELSDKKAMEIVDKWATLVTGNAVKPNSADESHVRRQLGFPDMVVDDKESIPVDPTTALSGIQVTSMMEVIDRVALKKIPRQTGIQILLNSFPINETTAESIMGEVGKGFEPKSAEPKVPIGGDPNAEQLPENANEKGGDPTEGDPPEDDSPDETVIGRQGAANIEAKLAAAQNRVAFAVIDKKTGDIESEAVLDLSAIITNATENMLMSVTETSAMDIVQSLKFSSRDVIKIRNRSKKMLNSAWTLGVKHAKDEVSKAKGEIFKASFERLDTEAGAFFDDRSFTVAGKLTNDMLAIVQNTVSNSIKASMTRVDTVDSIYEQFAAAGFITPEDAQEQMQGILQATEAATARLNTVVRTNVFEALNEARYSYFTDPELGTFVEALEYSAILDSRTTQICRHLDGQTHAATGEVWDGAFRPPNHFNCRSILIPVTEFDKWSEDEPPTQVPQSGFGG